MPLIKLGASLARALIWLALSLVLAWGAAALWIDGPSARWLAGLLAAGYVALSLALVIRIRVFRGGAVAALLPFAAVLAWWLSIPASNDRDWLPDVARPPVAEINGNLVTIRNIRNFEYRTSDADFVEHWDTRSYDLDRIVGMDLFLSYWGPTLIAHTIVSWEFSDGQHLAVSIETRKEKGEEYSAVLGFFRQFELYYVVADERDVIGVRANHRGEQIYLYRLRAPPDRARALLVHYLVEINRLARQPAWYNALTQSCTTTIEHNVKAIGVAMAFDWRIFANGRLDELLYEVGSINNTLRFPELRSRSDITAKVKAAGAAPDFSQRIREGLPERPPRNPLPER
ncbi:MAG TPA: DUF4105 domain-containing protein [Burkholderiales bacterium]|nr:DUF4105 domain-containing protein [Burkholderiales bacterium]